MTLFNCWTTDVENDTIYSSEFAKFLTPNVFNFLLKRRRNSNTIYIGNKLKLNI